MFGIQRCSLARVCPPLLFVIATLPCAGRAGGEELPGEAVLLRVKKSNLTVERMDATSVHLGAGLTGLIIWGEGPAERWQVFTGDWTRPSRELLAEDLSQLALGRSRGGRGEVAGNVALLTMQLAQLRGDTAFRGTKLLAPPTDRPLLDPHVTIRRQSKEGKLPAVEAVISRDGRELAKLPLKEGQEAVRWADVPGLPAQGLEPGSYRVMLLPGGEAANFTTVAAPRRAAVMGRLDELAQLLGGRGDPLWAQVAAEHLLSPGAKGGGFPYLADTLDLLDQVPEGRQTPPLRRLRQYAWQRLEDPGQKPALRAPSTDATHVPDIDRVRDLIADGQWDQAEREVNAVLNGKDASARVRGLAALYSGVIFAEAGYGREDEAVVAFQQGLRDLRDAAAEDRFRAHNDYANFLLGRAEDCLHNHAFQMATGARRPLLTALANWLEAEEQYRAALTLSEGLPAAQMAAVRVNRARLYVLLADLIRTLDTGHRFTEGERAAAETARDLAGRAAAAKGAAVEPLLRAIAEEVQAHLDFRAGDVDSCLRRAQAAREAYVVHGSLAGAESVERLLGLILRGLAGTGGDSAAARRARQEAIRHFRIAERLSEVERERFPADRAGRSRAGFFARRAYVNEMLVELLVAEADAKGALLAAEQAKARALQDLLAEGATLAAPGAADDLPRLLQAWPKDMAALEYFLGGERAWAFLVTVDGEVRAFELKTADGQPLRSRDLVGRVKQFQTSVGRQAPKMLRCLQSGRGLDNTWQDVLHKFYLELIPEPARTELRRARTVLVVPHHILHYFPFVALVTRRDEAPRGKDEIVKPRFLLDEPFDLCFAPSLHSWGVLRHRPRRPVTQVAALGIPALPGTPELPGVEEDVENLKASFGDKVSRIYIGADANESNARALLRKPGLVLFAMHGTNVPDRPLFSHLHLYPRGDDNGLLTAVKVYAGRVDSDLVVMSACYSGLADRSPLPGDDLFGLQRAFLQAGARAVVSGLWDVYDGTGPELMGGFFRNLSGGATAPTALAASQRGFLKKLRESKEVEFWLHPYFWAMYTVTGDDRVSCGQLSN
jgi:CHAT domain-containing protein